MKAAHRLNSEAGSNEGKGGLSVGTGRGRAGAEMAAQSNKCPDSTFDLRRGARPRHVIVAGFGTPVLHNREINESLHPSPIRI